MTARGWFEYIRAEVLALEDRKRDLETMRLQAEGGGGGYEAMGKGGTPSDAGPGVIRLVQASEDIDRDQAGINAEIEQALAVLYGNDGDGGLAKLKTSADADILCAYYLQGMEWEQVANDLSAEGSASPKHWCVMRARRALDFIERYGVRNLQRF